MHPLEVGTEIVKVNSQPNDGHQDGARGRVVSVLGPFDVPGYASRYGYFIVWQDFPVPVFTIAERITPYVM